MGYAQRDERLRGRLAEGMQTLRETFARFAAASAADAGLEPPPHATEQFANVVLGLGVLGLPLLRLIDPDGVPKALLGAVLSMLIRGVESSAEVRELLADPDRESVPN